MFYMWNFEAIFLKTSSGQLLPRNFGSYWIVDKEWYGQQVSKESGLNKEIQADFVKNVTRLALSTLE